jgi:hypothetical protein
MYDCGSYEAAGLTSRSVSHAGAYDWWSYLAGSAGAVTRTTTDGRIWQEQLAPCGAELR